jgi:hypothetical protein
LKKNINYDLGSFMKQRYKFFKVKIQCLLEEVDNKPLDSMSTVHKQILINAKSKTGKRVQK